MQIFLSKSVMRFLTVLFAAVILLFSMVQGAANGRFKAESLVISSNSLNLMQGLRYFYSDQERFPSALEFQGDNSKQVMLNYFSDFPPANLSGGLCQQSFTYQRPTLDTFKLNVCLPQGVDSFNAGWNELNEKN